MNGKWTQEETDQLINLVRSRISNEDIAHVMRRSISSIEHKLYRMKVYRLQRYVPDEVFRELWAERQGGKTTRKLAKQTGFSTWQLYARWRDMGLVQPVKAPLTIRALKALYTRHMAGERVSVLANEVGIKPRALRDMWNRSKCGPIRYDRPVADLMEIDAAIKARAQRIKWKDIPKHIGSTRSVNALRLAVHYRKKRGS